MTDDDIETNLTAGAIELRRNPAFAFRSAPKVRGYVDNWDKATHVSGNCVDLGH